MASYFAPGIKDKKKFGDLDRVIPGASYDYVRQLHIARKAGKHFDWRFGNPDTNLYSWVTRKQYPKEGDGIGIFRQPLHDYSYKDFQGTIPPGYGQGPVSKADEGRLLITRKSDDNRKLSFTTSHSQDAKRYAIIHSAEGRDWKHALLVRARDPEVTGVHKPVMRNINPDQAKAYLRSLPATAVAQPKIDGALSQVTFDKHRNIELLSHRNSVRTGKPIVHTERFFGSRPTVSKMPAQYLNSVLLGETYGVDSKGTVIPPQELGGILNSTIDNSLKQQKKDGITLKTLLFDVAKLHGKMFQSDEADNYDKRMETLKEIVKYLPKDKFTIATGVVGPDAALKLYHEIKSGKHPLTAEGLIVRDGADTAKVKLTKEDDVYVKDVFPGEGKYKDTAAGGFTYGLSKTGPAVGRVGTGLSDNLRKMLWKTPEEYMNRVARIRSLGQFNSGAYRAPSLIALHESKN